MTTTGRKFRKYLVGQVVSSYDKDQGKYIILYIAELPEAELNWKNVGFVEGLMKKSGLNKFIDARPGDSKAMAAVPGPNKDKVYIHIELKLKGETLNDTDMNEAIKCMSEIRDGLNGSGLLRTNLSNYRG